MKAALLIFGIVIGGLVILALTVYVVGVFLPPDHVAEGEVLVAQPVEVLAARIRDIEAQPRWRRGVKSIEILQREGGAISRSWWGRHNHFSLPGRRTKPAFRECYCGRQTTLRWPVAYYART